MLFLWVLFLSALGQDPCSSSVSDWMTHLNNLVNSTDAQNSNAWPNQPLQNILIPGSDHTGLWTISKKSFLGNVFPDGLFITQRYDILNQLCLGSRWFDLRLTFIDGQYVTFHGELVVGYGANLTYIINQTQKFLSYPRYSKELIFWRIKLDNGNATEVARILRSSLSPYIVDKAEAGEEDTVLSTYKLKDIWERNPDRGNLVLMSFQWIPPRVDPVKRQGWIWSFESTHTGKFADATYFSGVMTKCGVGQQVKLSSYYSKYLANKTDAARPLLSSWWTFTGGDVSANTKANWNLYVSPFKDYYVRNEGEVGNIIVSDFIGNPNYNFFLYIFMYNKNKYATFPPISPIFNLTISEPHLPGWDLVPWNASGFCDDSGKDNAGKFLLNQAIGLLFGVSFGAVLVLACCATCVGFYIHKKIVQKDYEPVIN